MAQPDLTGWTEVTSHGDMNDGRRVFILSTPERAEFEPAEVNILGVPNAVYLDEIGETHFRPAHILNVPVEWRQVYLIKKGRRH